MDFATARQHGIPTAPFRELEENRITPAEYAERVRREVQEAVKESPPPPRERKHENGEEQERP